MENYPHSGKISRPILFMCIGLVNWRKYPHGAKAVFYLSKLEENIHVVGKVICKFGTLNGNIPMHGKKKCVFH